MNEPKQICANFYLILLIAAFCYNQSLCLKNELYNVNCVYTNSIMKITADCSLGLNKKKTKNIRQKRAHFIIYIKDLTQTTWILNFHVPFYV
jgi:hypothetical protein